ncbi:MAG: hypothetical protein WBB25_00975 [Sulfitobacter sp.]
MFNAQKKLEVTQDELAVIQAALETQAKILTVQAGAGGSGARRRLNEVEKVLAQTVRHRDVKGKRRTRFGLGWFGSACNAG